MVEKATSVEATPLRTAALLAAAWAVPGLGHVLLGRWARGLLFGTLIWTCFGLGLAHDGRLALRNAREQPLLARLRVYGQAAYALPSDPAAPAYSHRINILRRRSRSGVSLYGTAYLWTAGLMNLLLLFDVWDLVRGKKR